MYLFIIFFFFLGGGAGLNPELRLFQKNFEEYAPQCLPAVVQAGPQAPKEASGYP